MTRKIDIPGLIIASILTLIVVVPLVVVALWSISDNWRYPAVLPPEFGLLVAIAAIYLQLNLIGTFWGVVLIQLVGTLLFMIWIPVAAFQAVDRRMEEAARDVGARPLRVFWSITLPQAAPTVSAAVLLTFVNTFYEIEGAWLIGAPQIRTLPVLMISFINNQPVIQLGAVLSMILWIPSLFALIFSRKVINSGNFAKGFGG